MADETTINGFKVDSSGVSFKINGKPYAIIDITWTDGKKPGSVQGSGGAQRKGRTRGKYAASGTLKVTVDEAEAIETDLDGPVFDTEWEGSLAYEENGKTQYVELQSSLFTDRKDGSTGDSDEGLMREYEVDITLVKVNGRKPIRDAKG